MLADRGAELEQAAQEHGTEWSLLEKLKEEVDAAQSSHAKHVSGEKAKLEAREKTLVAAEKAGRDAFTSFERKCREALHSLYGEGTTSHW